MVLLLRGTVEPPTMRITSLWPATRWAVVWKNVQMMPGTELVKVHWYQLIHDIVPTNARLRRIALTASEIICVRFAMALTLYPIESRSAGRALLHGAGLVPG